MCVCVCVCVCACEQLAQVVTRVKERGVKTILSKSTILSIPCHHHKPVAGQNGMKRQWFMVHGKLRRLIKGITMTVETVNYRFI